MHTYFFIRTDGRFIKVYFKDILFIEGCKNYVRIYTEEKFFMVLVTMKKMEQALPFNLFCRVHKSYIVAKEKIMGFDSDTIYLKNRELPLGQQYKQSFMNSVLIIGNNENEILINAPAIGIENVINGAVYVA